MRTKGLTGWHIFAIIAGGFSIVIAVNMLLAFQAVRTNQSTIVDNSYVASQEFNRGLDEGRAQAELGWTVNASSMADALRIEARDAIGQPLSGLDIEASITKVLGSDPARTLHFQETGAGIYDAEALPDGRWVAEIRLHRGSQQYYLKKRFSGHD